jgi:hypothetical protein
MVVLVASKNIEYQSDVEDAWLLSQYTWYLTSTGYLATKAKQNSPVGVPKELIYMHRLIMMPPKEIEIDHINRDKTDNRKKNLRYADRSLNCSNIGVQRNNTSGKTGVSFCKLKQKWRAYFGSKRKAGFATKEEAIAWRNNITGHGGSCGV